MPGKVVFYATVLSRGPASAQALTEATGRSLAQLKKELETSGDIGSVAAASRGSQRTMMAPKRLTVQSVSGAERLEATLTLMRTLPAVTISLLRPRC